MGKTKTLLSILFQLCFLISCAPRQLTADNPPEHWGKRALSIDEVIGTTADYSTEKGKNLRIKHEKNLGNIFNDIRSKYEFTKVEFVPVAQIDHKRIGGLGFQKCIGYCNSLSTANDDRYLAVMVVLPSDSFDKLQSTFNERAAKIFSKYAKSLLTIMVNQTDIISDKDIEGIWLSMAWSTTNQQNPASLRLRGEAINIVTSKIHGEEFISSAISDQEFISKSQIFGAQEGKDLGKVNLTLEISKGRPQ
jgi:hypothetical protein